MRDGAGMGGRGFLLLAAASCLAAGAQSNPSEFRIGQAAVPEAVVHKNSAAFRVHPKHPRLYSRDTDLPAIRARIAGSHAEDWREMTRYLEGQLLKKGPAAYGRGPYLKSWQYGRNMAFAAAVSGEPRYRDWAMRWARSMAAADPKKDDTDDHYRGRLMSLAVAYDWLHPWLSEEVRLVEGNGCVGAHAAGWTVVFPLSPAAAASVSYDAPGRGAHLVTGLVPERKGSLSADGRSKPVGSGAGGCAAFQADRPGRVSVQVPR